MGTNQPVNMMGGFDSGRTPHDAGGPTLIPVPSLLRSLLSDHLDPGYAAAANSKEQRARPAEWTWQVLAAVVVTTVFALAWAQAQSTAPRVRESQQVLAGSVRSAEATTEELTGRRTRLAAEVNTQRRSLLEGDAAGRQLLDDLDRANAAASSTPVIGPGMAITVTDPGNAPDLTDASKGRVEGSRQVILDRDLQLAVNSLWASGAEAISVGGVRVGPNVTIRQAGASILVDNQPITGPYVILAVGPPHAMQDAFAQSKGLQRLRLLETSYDVGVTVAAGDGLTLPAGSIRDINFAKQIGPN